MVVGKWEGLLGVESTWGGGSTIEIRLGGGPESQNVFKAICVELSVSIDPKDLVNNDLHQQ